MTDLATHIQICIAMKKEHLLSNQNVRMIWKLAEDHAKEITCEDFINAISKSPTTTNTVEPIKEK